MNTLENGECKHNFTKFPSGICIAFVFVNVCKYLAVLGFYVLLFGTQ